MVVRSSGDQVIYPQINISPQVLWSSFNTSKDEFFIALVDDFNVIVIIFAMLVS